MEITFFRETDLPVPHPPDDLAVQKVTMYDHVDSAAMHRVLDRYPNMNKLVHCIGKVPAGHFRQVEDLTLCYVRCKDLEYICSGATRKLCVRFLDVGDIPRACAGVRCETVSFHFDSREVPDLQSFRDLAASGKIRSLTLGNGRWSYAQHVSIVEACAAHKVKFNFKGEVTHAVSYWRLHWAHGFEGGDMFHDPCPDHKFYRQALRVSTLYHALRGRATAVRRLLRGDGDNAIMWRVVELLGDKYDKEGSWN